jgi:myo-inositol-1(or 4)-monophosphatase
VDDPALAASLVHDAGTLAARMLADGLQAQYKTSVSDIVTAADKAAEALIGERLAAERPDDGVVGEEGTSRPGERVWYLDPVDGTYNFLSGLPEWCSAVALCAGSQALVGAVYQASSDELWLGGVDVPTSRNAVPVAPLVDRPLAHVSIASYLHPTTLPDDSVRVPLLRAVQGAATVRMLGSGSVERAAVAAGRLGAWVQYSSLPWDWYPGAALVRAAGGTAEIVPAHGHDWHIAGSKQTVDEIAELIQSAD